MAKKVTDAEIKAGIECTIDLFKGAAGKRRWSRSAWARDADNKAVSPIDPTACFWCLEGGIIKCTDGPRRGTADTPRRVGRAVFDFLLELANAPLLYMVNDYDGYDAVMKLLRKGRRKISDRIVATEKGAK